MSVSLCKWVTEDEEKACRGTGIGIKSRASFYEVIR
jgi:hypothetical protein